MRQALTRSAALALAAFALAACATLNPIARTLRPPPDPTTQIPALEQRIYKLVEDEREKINPKATPLALDSELAAVARAHSQDMAAKHYFGHRSPQGETSATIIMARDANFQGLLGENIAAQYYTKQAGIDVEAYAKRFVETWLKSKSHRENLTFSDYQRTGVGVAIDGHKVYVTQLFSADLDKSAPSAKDGTDHRKISTYPDPGTAKASDPPPGRDVRLRGAMGLGMLPGETPGDGQAK